MTQSAKSPLWNGALVVRAGLHTIFGRPVSKSGDSSESVTALQAVGGAAIIAGLVLARLGQVAPKQIPADPMTNVMAEE